MQYLFSILYTVPGAVITITIHEYVKALVSTRLGDPLPKNRGRLTLNPLKHLEPIGFIIMIFFGFGWGKPAETAQMYYCDQERDTLITYITPSLINILLGISFAMLLYISKIVYTASIIMYNESEIGYKLFIVVYNVIYNIAGCNLATAVFNIIPVYPLDGSKVLSVMSPLQAAKVSGYEKAFQLLLLVLIFVGVIGGIINPIVDAVLKFAAL